MLRIIVQTVDSGTAVHVGGPIETTVKSFDIDCPELEHYLRQADSWSHCHRQIIGAECVGDPPVAQEADEVFTVSNKKV